MERRLDDFDRVRDLLGDVCEGAAVPPSAEDTRGSGQRDESDDERRRREGPRVRTRPKDPSRAVAMAWPEVAGSEVAANTTPLQLRAGRLVVSTSSSVWAQTLQFMADELVDGLNERLGADTVQKIVFRHAGWEERPRTTEPERSEATERAPRTAGGLTPAQKQAIADLEELDLPPDIKERIACAMKASFVRGEQDPVR